MVLGRPNLGRILVDNGYITDEQLNTALEYQTIHGFRLGEALVALHLCTDVDIARALAEQLEIPFVDLVAAPPSPDCVALITREVALTFGILPVRMEGDRLLVAARDPFDVRVDEALRTATDLPVTLAIAPESQLNELLHQFYREQIFDTPRAEAKNEPEEIEEDDNAVSLERLIAAGEEVSAVRVVNALIVDAVRRGTSDLHIEPENDKVRVRYRIDGRLRSAVSFPRGLMPNVAARIKIMSGMDISETRKPQDGNCRVRVDARDIELRVSTLRGVYGEIIVLRILNQNAGLHKLDALGFQPNVLRDCRRLLAARQGLILIAGPTGSGKTTTLYASVNHLNREDTNIMTVEDPVEMKLAGVNQIQVHDRAGRSFASTLRALLRQDPDIIMVGEIRDVETADIACRAALTGHLVLSTIHTQHALGTVARLLDMGVAPWLVAACLKGIFAQRLVQRVCDECAAEHNPSAGLRRALEAEFGSLAGVRFRRGRGCTTCHQAGTHGRVGVYELLKIDEDLRQMLAEAKGTKSLREHVLARGFKSMEEDAFLKACAGIVPPEEVVELGFSVAMALDEEAHSPLGDMAEGPLRPLSAPTAHKVAEPFTLTKEWPSLAEV
jgi:type IV pilus assembly protein PilB